MKPPSPTELRQAARLLRQVARDGTHDFFRDSLEWTQAEWERQEVAAATALRRVANHLQKEAAST